MAFWQRWFRNERGHFVAGFQSFPTADEFETVFERNLRAWLHDREIEVTWTRGSPYRGLEPFDLEHAPIFFGRRREVERARARLIASAAAGKPFLLIIGASGAGKSSLARAGLIPRLAQLGGLSTLAAALRWTILTPGQIANDWTLGLATRLFETNAIGNELQLGDFDSANKLAAQVARADASACAPLIRALQRAGEKIAMAEKRELPPKVALLILIDQLEEVFAWPTERAASFLNFMLAICRLPEQPIMVVATMRSDFQHRIAEFAALAALVGRSEIKGPYEAEQTLELSLPSSGDLREMIVNPARAAGLRFEVEAERDLAQLIEAEARPEAMSSVQFLLSELYAARDGKVLTLAAFDALRGVHGVMAKRGEDVYWAADQSARDAFPRVVRALATRLRSDVPASTRRVSEQAFADDPSAARMIAALREARLIISDRGELRFAHDSLLTGWARLEEQVAEEQRLFSARERLEQYCARWTENAAEPEGKRDQLLLEGFPLAEGRELLAKWGAAALTDKQPALPAYIRASDAREKRARRTVQAVGWGIAAVFALFSVGLFHAWETALKAKTEAEASLWIAQSQADLREGNVAAALDRADRAFKSMPTERSRSTLLSALMEVSPHVLAVTGVRGETSVALAWLDGARLVFASGSGQLHTVPLGTASAQHGGNWQGSALARSQDSNPSVIRALHAVAADQLIAVFADGTTGFLGQNANNAQRHQASEAMSLNPTAHAVAIGPRGATVVTAGVDETIALHRCDWTRTNSPCDPPKILETARGRALAISPDGMQIAVGDQTGLVTLFDVTGKRVREPEDFGAPIVALGWAPQRNWIAAGTNHGEIIVFDAGSPLGSLVDRKRFGDRPVSVLAWAPDDLKLVFVCDALSLCLWRSHDGDPAHRFKPAVRLEGHTNSVTRLAWAPTGRHLASSDIDGTIRIWDVVPNTEVHYALYSDQPAEFVTVAATRDGRQVASGAKDGTIRLWPTTDPNPSRTIIVPSKSEVQALTWSLNGTLAAIHENGTVTGISPDAEPHTVPVEQLGAKSRLAWVDNGSLLAIPLQDGRIALVSAKHSSGEQPRFLPAVSPEHSASSGLAVDLAKRRLFAAYVSGEVRVWDLATNTHESMRETRDDRIRNVGARSLSVSPDGQWLATTGADRFVPIYDVARRTSLPSLETDSSDTITVAFSPNGQRLAALGSDNRLYVWDFAHGAASLFLAVNVVPKRTTVGETSERAERASWLAWLSDDSLAVVTGTAAVTVIQLDPGKWRGRVDGVARRHLGPQ
jgi:WD40 repeat protein